MQRYSLAEADEVTLFRYVKYLDISDPFKGKLTLNPATIDWIGEALLYFYDKFNRIKLKLAVDLSKFMI